MKENPVRYSSAVGESWHHLMMKVKYCHKIFDDSRIREACNRLILEAFERYHIRYRTIGFDSDHVHSIVDIGLYSRPQFAKLVKGYIGKKLLEQFPEVKKKYFYGSGLWNPATYLDSVGKDIEFMERYVNKQRYAVGLQKKISDYFAPRHATSL